MHAVRPRPRPLLPLLRALHGRTRSRIRRGGDPFEHRHAAHAAIALRRQRRIQPERRHLRPFGALRGAFEVGGRFVWRFDGIFGREIVGSALVERERRENDALERRTRSGTRLRLRLAGEVLFVADGAHVARENGEEGGFGVGFDEIFDVVAAAGDAGEQCGDGGVVEELEMVQAVVEEVDDVATVFFVAHDGGVVR